MGGRIGWCEANLIVATVAMEYQLLLGLKSCWSWRAAGAWGWEKSAEFFRGKSCCSPDALGQPFLRSDRSIRCTSAAASNALGVWVCLEVGAVVQGHGSMVLHAILDAAQLAQAKETKTNRQTDRKHHCPAGLHHVLRYQLGKFRDSRIRHGL